MKILILDPSIHNVGWTLLDTKKKTMRKAWKFGTFKLEGNNFLAKLTHLRDLIDEKIGPFDILIGEKPAFFSSERGQIAAHMNYTIDLAAVIFWIAGWYHMDHRHFFAITANQWKGSVSKDITARRFFKQFPKIKPTSIDEHAIDAAMLGHFWLTTMASHLHRSVLPVSREKLELLAGCPVW